MLGAGLYGIVGNNGGHAEIVEGYGTVVNIDKPMTAKMLTTDKIPSIDRSLVVGAIKAYYENRSEFSD